MTDRIERTTENRAMRDSWKTLPMPEEKHSIPFVRRFTSEEYQIVSRGLIPQEMEDRWFIYLQNNQLFFHRSWTGYCIFQLRLEKIQQDYIVTDCHVNRNSTQYEETNDRYDASLLSFLIDALLLSKETRFPLKEESMTSLSLAELGTVYSKGSSFRARAEARQREYRASKLQVGWRKYGHILDEAAALAGRNFLSPIALKAACSRAQKKGVAPRTFKNMLSSQAMCFNVFAPLQSDRQFARLVLSRFFPTVTEVNEILIEYTPESSVFGDQSGLGGVDCDVCIRAEDSDGRNLIIVIETKFVETEFSICGFRKPGRKLKGQDVCPDRIELVNDQHNCLYVAKKHYKYWVRSLENQTLAFDQFPHTACPFAGPLWQIWVNHTLAYVEASKLDGRAIFAICAPARNLPLLQNGELLEQFRRLLKQPESAVFINLDDLIQSILTFGATRKQEYQAWMEGLTDRYAGI